MKIGIVTYWWSKDNYGQIFQLYALHTFLKELGHEPFLIRYIPQNENFTRKSRVRIIFDLIHNGNPTEFRDYIKKLIDKLKTDKSKNQNNNDLRAFDKFLKRNINYSEKVYYSSKDIKESPPEADVYICGSDQIWNQSEDRINPTFFLDFGERSIKRISFAASFGRDEKSNEFCSLINPFLKEFDLVTVREESGISICAKAGRDDAVWVPDPTLLLCKNIYLNLIEKPKEQANYCFQYLLGSDTAYPDKAVKLFLSNNNLKMIYTASQRRIDRDVKVYPTINQWLGYMYYSNFVITNSFHGTVFSILFNKPFVFLPLKGKFKASNDRVRSLLTMLEIKDRMYNGSFDELLNENIDYNKVNQIIKQKSEEVKQLINNCLTTY